MKRIRVWNFVLLLVVAVAAGCRGKSSAPAQPEKYPIQGKVMAVDTAGQRITLDHGAIPGFMEAMTMDYRVDDPAVLTEVHPGDRISATLLAERDAAGPKNLRLHEVVVTAQARPDYKPPVTYHVPQAGEVVPSFRLLNQDGKQVDLKKFRGKVVAMTFIYTRCPLADFCPRMSRNFAEIDADLAKDPALYGKTHLLSVSFDPKYDTPKVLRSYGGGVTGKFTNENFAHWDFAAPQGEELLNMEKWFAVGVTPGEQGTLNHSLATTIIGKDGRVVAFYPGNDWKVSDVLALIRQSANS